MSKIVEYAVMLIQCWGNKCFLWATALNFFSDIKEVIKRGPKGSNIIIHN